jgi:hypothetical protein
MYVTFPIFPHRPSRGRTYFRNIEDRCGCVTVFSYSYASHAAFAIYKLFLLWCFLNRKASLSMLEIRWQKQWASFCLHRSRANPSKCGWAHRSFELSDRFERSANSFIWQFASRSSLFSFRSENQGSLITLERSLNLKERRAQLCLKVLSNGAGGGPTLVSIDPFW